MASFDLESRVEVPADVLFRELDGEAVVLNLDTGTYFGLDEVGTLMWSALATHGTLGGAIAELEHVFEVDPDRLSSDLLEFATALAERQLLRITSEG